MKMVSLLKTAKKQPYLNMFTKKRSNKGVLWASLISIGVSTLMMMLSKGKREKVTSSFQNMTKNISKSKIPMMNSALAEFGAEFFSKNIPAKGKASHRDSEGSSEFGEEFHSKNIEAKAEASKLNNSGANEFMKEFQSNNIPSGGEITNMNDAALTEFSEELLSKALENK
jgi:hypothetical protein